jgi:hypothetical protein
MKITDELELKLIEYYLAPHTLRDTAYNVLGHKSTKATSLVLAKHGIPKHNKESVKNLREATCLAKYGVKNYSASYDIKEKQNHTVKTKYGVDNVFQAPVIKEQIKQTCLKRYGATHFNKTIEGKAKREQTCLTKYGVRWYTQTDEYKKLRKQKNKKLTKLF